jgi:hypothetical protein
MVYLLIAIPFVYWMLSTGAGAVGIWFSRASVDDYHKECVKRLDTTIWPYLLSHFSDWDIDAIYAIIAWETGWLSDPNSKLRVNTYHNLLGLDIQGKPGVGRQYAYYWECLHYFQRLISGKFGTRYNGAYPARGDGVAFLTLLHEAGYNSNDSWLRGVLDCYQKMSYLH